MITKNFERLQAEVVAHVAADRVAQGSYESCFIGCLANGRDDPGFIENEYGIPLMVTRIAESIFEGLPADEAPAFFAAIPQAVACDGKDLSRVGWKFLAADLRALPPVPDDIQAAIDPVIEGMDLLADGKKWSEAVADATCSSEAVLSASDVANFVARATARDAWLAARADATFWPASAATRAAWSADDAVCCAANTAYANAYANANADAAGAGADAKAAVYYAARRRQRDILLRLIKEAPINTQEEN